MAKDRGGPCLLVRPIPSGERASDEVAAVRREPQECRKCHFQNSVWGGRVVWKGRVAPHVRVEGRAGCGMWLTGRSPHLEAQFSVFFMLKLIWQVPEPKAIAVR